MCRFVAYLGKPLVLDEVLFKPENSLVKQSYHAREMSEPLNGDGFGVGWYNHDIDLSPALFTSIQPAWNNRNLTYLAKKIRTDAFFAHVRTASHGCVTPYNCHPFIYQRFLFMHNGTIHGFNKIKRSLRRSLSDNIYEWIKGQTDSEHFFALFLENFNHQNKPSNANTIASALKNAIQNLEKFTKENKVNKTMFINAVVSDGKSMVALRYVSDSKQTPRTLYVTTGSEYRVLDNQSHLEPCTGPNEAVMVVSEKLTHKKTEWDEVPMNEMVLVHDDLSITGAKIH